MTDSEKLLLFALEAARTDQLDALLALSEAKGEPLAALITSSLAEKLATLSETERRDALSQFKALGIDLEDR
jgi:hypothetical protein